MKRFVTKFLSDYGVLFGAVLGVALLSSYFIAANAATKNPNPKERVLIFEKSKKNHEKCGLENCHGTNFVCSDKPAQMCTENYEIGDFCRQYAKCRISHGKCGLKHSKKLERCIDCVTACKDSKTEEPSVCEEKCRNQK